MIAERLPSLVNDLPERLRRKAMGVLDLIASPWFRTTSSNRNFTILEFPDIDHALETSIIGPPLE